MSEKPSSRRKLAHRLAQAEEDTHQRPESPYVDSVEGDARHLNDSTVASSSAALIHSHSERLDRHRHKGTFAETIVNDLEVEDEDVPVAMSVVEIVSKISTAQIARLDSATRLQVLQIREEIGLTTEGQMPGELRDGNSSSPKTERGVWTPGKTPFKSNYETSFISTPGEGGNNGYDEYDRLGDEIFDQIERLGL